MREENYLYFATSGQNDADKDAVMYPASAFRGAVTLSSTTMEFFFAPLDGTGTVPDGVEVTHADVAANTVDGSSTYGSAVHYTIMQKFADMANANRPNQPNFNVVKDLNTNLPSAAGAISSTGIDEITAITITTA
tara:strand:+ start:729 stop:1133 length:405 start_codon:yes stop_codon:yes gene_type:complete